MKKSTSFMHSTAIVDNSKTGKNYAFFRNSVVKDCNIEDSVSIGDDSTVVNSIIQGHVAINRRNYINNCSIGKFSYTGINTIINFCKIGNFVSIARNVDIGGFDHDYRMVTTMPMFRFKQLLTPEDGKINVLDSPLLEIGHDCWIAAGAIILHKAKIGNGAVIGAGAVVTKDIPPYAIAVGVPARVVGYRFSKSLIERLENLAWWSWDENILKEIAPKLISSELNEELIEQLEELKKTIE